MATAAAGGNPPPDPGNGNRNNGNTSLTDINQLLESVSDINLRLMQLGNKFLSAKNSVELHKTKARRQYFPYHSLPSVFNSADLESWDESGSGPSSQEPIQESFTPRPASPTRSNHGRSVNWADLHSSHGYQILANHQNRFPITNSIFKLSTVVENSENSRERPAGSDEDLNETSSSLDRNCTAHAPPKALPNVSESGSHTSLYLNSRPLSEDVSVSVLLAPTQINPFIPGKSVMDIDMFEQTFMDLHTAFTPTRTLREEKASSNATADWYHQQISENESLVPIPMPMPSELIPRSVIGIGQTPNLRPSLSGNLIDDFTPSCLINSDDGLELHPGIGIRNPDLQQSESVYFSPIMDNSVLHSVPIPRQIEYCSLPQVTQVSDQRPISVYFEESFILPQTPKQPIGDQGVVEGKEMNNLHLSPHPGNDNTQSSKYDTDDELDMDKPPEFVMKTADELPVPDPEYIAATVSENLRPLIAKRFKKDCRTWLWKSKAQREARLKKQAEDELNEFTGGSASRTSTQSAERDTMTEEQMLLETQIRELDINTYYS